MGAQPAGLEEVQPRGAIIILQLHILEILEDFSG